MIGFESYFDGLLNQLSISMGNHEPMACQLTPLLVALKAIRRAIHSSLPIRSSTHHPRAISLTYHQRKIDFYFVV